MAMNMRRCVGEWLEAERSGRTEDADLHFRAVARALPSLEAPPGFAAAVAARIRAVQAAPDLWARWWMRAAVAVCVLSAGVAGASLPLHGWIGAILTSLRAVAWGLGQGSSGAHAWVTSALALWAGLAQAAIVLGRQLVGPAPLVLLALNFAVAAGALAVLRRLIPLQEN